MISFLDAPVFPYYYNSNILFLRILLQIINAAAATLIAIAATNGITMLSSPVLQHSCHSFDPYSGWYFYLLPDL